MSKVQGLGRARRIGLASILLAAALLAAPLFSVHAEWGATLYAPIQVASGATLGTAAIAAAPGGVMITLTVNGFDPVAGSHRMAVAVGGACYPLSWWCAASEVVVLPEMQFQSNGSGSYMAIAPGVTIDWLARTAGTALIIHADSGAGSQVIGRGQITGGAPGTPHYPPPPPATVRYTVTATDGLRLRSGPGTWYSTRRIAGYGATLWGTGLQQWGGGILWTRVTYYGGTYWAARVWMRPY